MRQETLNEIAFGSSASLDESLSDQVRGLIGSEILKIAADIRQLVREGKTVCNLTVGDFDAAQFPIPQALRVRIHEAIDRGETNYPPSNGVLRLRQAVVEHVARTNGVRYPLESVLIASGARPLLYAGYLCTLNPGDTVIYPVPSWNNNHYSWIAGARQIAIETRPEDGFMPTLEQLQPHLAEAQLIAINSPLNPTGTVIDPEALRSLTQAVVEENRRRRRQGRRHVFLLHDQVYGALTFGDATHEHPVRLVPEAAPWVISLDAISKTFAATGLRVGWVTAAPELVARIKDVIGHLGAWAPRPEQVAVAGYLSDVDAVDEFQRDMNRRVFERLEALSEGFERLKAEGYPVDCICPQGAIYLSLRLELIGHRHRGRTLDSNETIRQLLLEEAGLAVVPFQAFGLREDTGWFRLSVGAVSLGDIEQAFPRIRRLLDETD